MSDRQKAEVYRCGGCERIYDKPQTHTLDGDEYDTPRCPYCGTQVDYEGTEVGEVAF